MRCDLSTTTISSFSSALHSIGWNLKKHAMIVITHDRRYRTADTTCTIYCVSVKPAIKHILQSCIVTIRVLY